MPLSYSSPLLRPSGWSSNSCVRRVILSRAFSRRRRFLHLRVRAARASDGAMRSAQAQRPCAAERRPFVVFASCLASHQFCFELQLDRSEKGACPRACPKRNRTPLRSAMVIVRHVAESTGAKASKAAPPASWSGSAAVQVGST